MDKTYRISSTIKEGEYITLTLSRGYDSKDPYNLLEYIDRLVCLAGYTLDNITVVNEEGVPCPYSVSHDEG